ncbi:hypothetical protein ACFY0A_32380 [Streptomyces sp. NPDC001698]
MEPGVGVVGLGVVGADLDRRLLEPDEDGELLRRADMRIHL